MALVSPGRLKVLDDGISMNNCQLGAHYSPTVCPTTYCSEHRAICSAPQSEKSLLRWEGGQLQSKPFERDAWIVAAVSIPEVRKCTAVTCPSWSFRMGTNPHREKRVLSPAQKAALAERLAKAKVQLHAACLSVQ